MTGAAPTQAPAWQVSPVVQVKPSEHGAPSGFAGFEQAPLAGSQVPATWHASSAEQTTAVAPAQTPDWQASPNVHASSSEHGAPSAFVGLEQTPVAGLQTPGSWQALLGRQTTGFAPTHVPAWQGSVCEQRFPSLHGTPFAFEGFEQAPVAGSHVPALWQVSDGTQTFGTVPVHTPAWQTSTAVHALPSLQGGPVSGAHVPFEGAPAAVEHASQGPAPHAVLQQTPSVQKPLWQSHASVHAAPLGLVPSQ